LAARRPVGLRDEWLYRPRRCLPRIDLAASCVTDPLRNGAGLQNSEIEMRRLVVSGLLVMSALAVLTLHVAPPLADAGGVPAGNNGTVKIHEGSTETEPMVQNEPQVCAFHLHFFFADPTQTGTWEIRDWAPGDKGDVVLSGTYDTSGDGIDRRPTTGTFSLADGHYKLFWVGRNEQNLKHKTFWVECASPTTSPTVAPSESVAPSGSVAPTESVAPSGSVAPTASSSTNPSGDVLPATGTPSTYVLPPTDTADAGAAGAVNAWIVILLVGIGTVAMFLTSTVALKRR
jgi:hypothetical protein